MKRLLVEIVVVFFPEKKADVLGFGVLFFSWMNVFFFVGFGGFNVG